MWGRKHNELEERRFQQLEAEIFSALDASSAEINEIAEAPFLYSRLRGRIEAEARRRAEAGRQWLNWLVIARQATPALAMVALLAIGTFWTFTEKTALNAGRGEAVASQTTLEVGGVVALSNDELIAALAGWDKQEPAASDNAITSATPKKEQ